MNLEQNPNYTRKSYVVFNQCPRKLKKHCLREYGGYRHTKVREYVTYWRHVSIGDIGNRYSRPRVGPDTCERDVCSYISDISYISIS